MIKSIKRTIDGKCKDSGWNKLSKSLTTKLHTFRIIMEFVEPIQKNFKVSASKLKIMTKTIGELWVDSGSSAIIKRKLNCVMLFLYIYFFLFWCFLTTSRSSKFHGGYNIESKGGNERKLKGKKGRIGFQDWMMKI